MKGVILAGGSGSRLYPLTKATNKHLLPVGRYPMIYYPIFKLKEAGVKDIFIVIGREHAGSIESLLGSGYEWGLKFTYRVQDQPGGIAHALALAKEFVRSDKFVVILGDNIFEDNIKDFVSNFSANGVGAKIFIKKVDDPQRYGIAELGCDRVLSIEEKPLCPKSNYCVTGIYMYDSSVFDIIEMLEPSRRGELEITDVNNGFIGMGKLQSEVLTGWWTDAGTFDSLKYANELVENMDLNLLN